MKFMTFNQKVLNLFELSDGVKVIGCGWVFKTNKDSQGNTEIQDNTCS